MCGVYVWGCVCVVCVGGLWKLSYMLIFPGNLNSKKKINPTHGNKHNESAVRGPRHRVRT